MANAGKTVRYLLGQRVVGPFFVAVVLKTIEVLKDLLMLTRGRCLMRFVMNVETAAKFLFSQAAGSQSTVAIALEIKRKVKTEIKININR